MMADKEQSIEWDRKYLIDRKDQWVQVNCPACEANTHQLFGEKNGFSYALCQNCGTVYTNPRPSQKLSHEFYAQSKNYEYWNRYIFPATEATRRVKIFQPRALRVAEYCRKHNVATGTLLEVGSAFGTFCEEIKKLGLFNRVIAVEPTPNLAQTCRNRDLETLECPIETIDAKSIANVVVAFEVVEHLFNPRHFIEQCSSLLHPCGLIVLSCPNIRGFDLATLHMLSKTFDHEHVNYFHPDSLSLLLRETGFINVEVQTPGQLDAEIVRRQSLTGALDLRHQPFLKHIFFEEWDQLGKSFQDFLASNKLSSHMWITAKKAD